MIISTFGTVRQIAQMLAKGRQMTATPCKMSARPCVMLATTKEASFLKKVDKQSELYVFWFDIASP